MKRIRVILEGRVQGTGFRYSARKAAEALELVGWIRNLRSGALECEAQGTSSALDQFVVLLLHGPTLARVEKMELEYIDALRGETEFAIRETV